MRLSLIIPVFNEEKTIRQILDKVFAQKAVSEIIIVDDGSTDKTREILEELKMPPRRQKIKIFFHKKNRGKGASLRTGLKSTTGDFVLFQDADLEYDPKEYAKLLEKVTPKSVVYGSRIKGKNPHAYARTYWGNVLITFLCNALYGVKLTDSYTCYKLLPTRVARSLHLNSNGFEIEAEITAKLAKKKIPIIEVPISYKPRSYEQGKKIKAKDALLGMLTFGRIRFS